MKLFNVLLAVLFLAEVGMLSTQRIHAQTTAPAHQQCPQNGQMSGMMDGSGGMMMQGMHGMHGPADRAYMQSMMAMHHGMHSQTMTGDADRDFMTMMIPHHEAAVDMAKTELKYGKNSKLRAMARQIIETQEAEIHQMRAMLQ